MQTAELASAVRAQLMQAKQELRGLESQFQTVKLKVRVLYQGLHVVSYLSIWRLLGSLETFVYSMAMLQSALRKRLKLESAL